MSDDRKDETIIIIDEQNDYVIQYKSKIKSQSINESFERALKNNL